MISKKIVLLGQMSVGKTSLMRQFVHSIFSEKYITTIGVTIEKKVIETSQGSLQMIIWDIAGELTLSQVSRNYLLGSAGVLYVFDLTRKPTYEKIRDELEYVKRLLPIASVQVLGNKSDLLSESQIAEILQPMEDLDIITTSAKTGEGVERAFKHLGKSLFS